MKKCSTHLYADRSQIPMSQVGGKICVGVGRGSSAEVGVGVAVISSYRNINFYPTQKKKLVSMNVSYQFIFCLLNSSINLKQVLFLYLFNIFVIIRMLGSLEMNH